MGTTIEHNRLSGIICLLLICCLFSCANPIAPTGGPEDVTPPKLDSLNSTPNMQTQFKKQDILLTFNEWVELRDVFNQVIVSPPLEFRPQVDRRKKTIQFRFDEREILRDSATYVINFGEAIRDLTEGNVAPIVFVFSTGDYIDSLSVQGRIVDAFTAEPVENVLFMLYENLADSAFRKERPFYFARTGKNGSFKVNNVKSGAFKAVALVDQNLNYRFDNEAEKIGFLDSAIVLSGVTTTDTTLLTPDSLRTDTISANAPVFDSLRTDSIAQVSAVPGLPPLRIRLFEEEKTLFLTDHESTTYGLVKFFFNREPHDVSLTPNQPDMFYYMEPVKDTVRFWYYLDQDTPFNIYVRRDTLTDTISIANDLKEGFYEKATLKPVQNAPNQPPVLSPGKPFDIAFNHPLAALDISLFRLFEDSTKTEVLPVPELDSLQKRSLLIDYPGKEGIRYEIEIAPGALTDIFGIVNADTIRRTWIAGAPKNFGVLTLQVDKLRPDTAYLIRLLDKNKVSFDTFRVAGKPSFSVTLQGVPPAVYTVEIIEDIDRNGRWTTGNYDLHRQPERVRRMTLEDVRANWEVDASVEWDDNPPEPVKKKENNTTENQGGESGTRNRSPGRQGG